MMFLLRCMLCLAIVYASILGLSRLSARPEIGRPTASRGAAGDAIARLALASCREHPSDCLAVLAAITPLARGVSEPKPGPAATPAAVEPTRPRHRRPAFRLTRAP